MKSLVSIALAIGMMVVAMPASASVYPSYQTVWRSVIKTPGCESSDFTKPNHPAHPGIIKRTITRRADGVWYANEEGHSFAPDAAQPAFKTWFAEIRALDRNLREDIQKQSTK